MLEDALKKPSQQQTSINELKYQAKKSEEQSY